jgi:hypothetical protein
MFSMPPGTPAQGVVAAARNFLREEFALKHRYAFVLHTDEAHPHVHAVVKATSEQGTRLNIRKSTLREWRSQFARHLRQQGIEANATERAVRGECKTNKIDAQYRAERRGVSTRSRAMEIATAAELSAGVLSPEPGKALLLQTRKEIERGWRAVTEILRRDGQQELASDVQRFVGMMRPPRTDREQIADSLTRAIHQTRVKTPSTR